MEPANLIRYKKKDITRHKYRSIKGDFSQEESRELSPVSIINYTTQDIEILPKCACR